jgi:hypothetical protein
MKARITIPDNPVVWQCIHHALLDYRNEPKQKTTYTFEAPGGECEVVIRKPNDEINVTWRLI